MPRREGLEGTDVFSFPSVCLVASSHSGAVCGQFWGCCWIEDLCFQKAVTVTSQEREQLIPDAFGVFPAGTANVWLLYWQCRGTSKLLSTCKSTHPNYSGVSRAEKSW